MELAAGWIRYAVAVAMLLIASWLDLQERRVRNPFWFPFLAIAGVFLILDLALLGPSAAFAWRWGTAVATCGLVYVLWYLGLLYGGADAKGLMVVALLLPVAPGDLLVSITPAVDTLVNGILFTLVLPVGFALTNAVKGRFGPAMFLAVRMSIEEARGAFVWPMDRVGGDGRIRVRYLQRRSEDMEAVYGELVDAGVEEVWATPKVPFMIPMTLGLLAAAAFGNLLLQIMVWVMLS